MSDTVEDPTDPIRINVEPQGVPTPIAVILLIALVLAVGFAIYFSGHPSESQACAANSIALTAQAESAKAQNQVNTTTQKRIMDVQYAVIKACVDHGNIPVLMGGNVDCKTPPK